MLWILELVAGMFTPLFLTLIFVTSFPMPVFIILLPFRAVILPLLSMLISSVGDSRCVTAYPRFSLRVRLHM